MVKLLYSDYYTGPFPPTHILERAVSILSEPKEYHLLGALQTGLGGPQYVLNGVKTKFGQIIGTILFFKVYNFIIIKVNLWYVIQYNKNVLDYLLVKCKSGQIYPLNPSEMIGNCNLSYESLNIPEDSFS
jgi:hypothetical protein